MLKNFWYAVELSASIDEKPKRLVVLGMELVVFRRRSDKRAVALSNLCVHRGGSLSDGWTKDDCVVCPYHGWNYDASGACTKIPANPREAPIPKKAHVDAYPVEERYGLVWVFLGDLPAAERPPIPPFPEYGLPGWRTVYGEFTWMAHYSRVVENGMDIAHTPFVHAASFGNREQPEIQSYEVTGDDFGGSATLSLMPPRPKGLWGFLRKQRTPVKVSPAFYMPNVARLDIDLGKWRTIVFDVNVPIDLHTTRTLFVQIRNFFTGAWADGDSRRRVLKIMREDQRTVESQRPELLPYDLAAELHVRSDALGVSYRRLRKKYLDMGWGIDSHLIRSAYTGRSAVVIPSPARRENADLARAWVMPEAPVIQLRRKPATNSRGETHVAAEDPRVADARADP